MSILGCKQVSLHIARITSGLTVEYVASQIGVPNEKIIEYETNPSDAPVHDAIRMAHLYRLCVDDISFGPGTVCRCKNRVK